LRPEPHSSVFVSAMVTPPLPVGAVVVGVGDAVVGVGEAVVGVGDAVVGVGDADVGDAVAVGVPLPPIVTSLQA